MHRYQTFGSRFLAAIIDGIIVAILGYLIIKLLPSNHFGSIMSSIINDGLFFFYSIYLHYRYGQTIGKIITNVKVVCNIDETKLIGLSNSFKRDSILMLLSVLSILIRHFDSHHQDFAESTIFVSAFVWLLADMISMLINKKNRALHDFLARSVVIDTKRTDIVV